jgi:predicted PurR-regulated permease PerM
MEAMFNTSIDIFYLVLSICLVVFTGFFVWAIFYVVQILKQGNEVVTELRVKMAELEEALLNIKDRVVTSANTISFIGKEISTVMDIVKSFKKSSTSKARRGKKSNSEETDE